MKASFEISGGSNERWPSLVLQGIVLSVCISFILKNHSNNYFYLSILLVFSLFILQSIYRRFLMLYPMNPKMKRPTPYVDTYVARIFIWIAYFMLFSGIYKAGHSGLPDLPEVVLVIVAVLGFLILPLTFWILSSKEIIQELLAKRLGKMCYVEKPVKCPKCNRGDAIFQRKVITSKEFEEKIICPDNNCDGSARSVPANIGN